MKRKIFKTQRNRSDQRLALLAKELGAAMMVVLVNDYGFSPEEADIALGKVVAQAKENRLMITTNAVTAVLDTLNKPDEA